MPWLLECGRRVTELEPAALCDTDRTMQPKCFMYMNLTWLRQDWVQWYSLHVSYSSLIRTPSPISPTSIALNMHLCFVRNGCSAVEIVRTKICGLQDCMVVYGISYDVWTTPTRVSGYLPRYVCSTSTNSEGLADFLYLYFATRATS